MTKPTRVAVAKKETVKKREKKTINPETVEHSVVTFSSSEVSSHDHNTDKVSTNKPLNVVDENIPQESSVKEKLKREKNHMPKKTAKKEHEIITPSSEAPSSKPTQSETGSVNTPTVEATHTSSQPVVETTSSVEPVAPVVEGENNKPTASAASEAAIIKQKFYSQQPQQHNKKFNNNKKQHKQHAHPQSSHYQQSHSQSSNTQNQSERYEHRGYDGHKQHHENTPKQPLTREQLEELSLQDLYVHAKRHGVIGAVLMSHKTLVEKILEMQQDPDREIIVEGVLEKLPDGFGFLRSARFDYVSSPDDIYVSPAQIRKMGLRTGDTILGTIRKPKDNEKYFALARIDKVNFSDPAKLHERPHFDRLSPMHPNKKFTLEYLPHYVSTRIMDIFTPIGKGQRGLIVAPPKAGKTVLSKEIAQSLIANHPEIFLIMLLIDERPEEVADMKRFVKGAHAEVISSTFDEPAERHVQVAEIVLEKAKRLVEVGKDVVIFLDSVTRLARAYNTVAPASGKILTGGVDANSLQRPKRFFGAARCLEEGGSLTILGSALIETGSRMDEVIYEEFKGTGNMEIHMSRKLSNRRIYPAFDLLVSGTRRDELLQTEEELNRSWVLQKFLANMNTAEAMEFLLDKMKKFKTNEEFFESMNPKKAGTNGTGSNGGSSHR